MIILIDRDAFPNDFLPVAYAMTREYARKQPIDNVHLISISEAGCFHSLRENVHVITSPYRRAEWAPFLDPACDLEEWTLTIPCSVDRLKARAFLKKDTESRQRSKLYGTYSLAMDKLADWLNSPFPEPIDVLAMPTPQEERSYRLATTQDILRWRDDIDEYYTADVVTEGDVQVALDFETDTTSHSSAIAIGFSFSINRGMAVYVPMRHKNGENVDIEAARELLRNIVKCRWVAHNASFELAVLANEGIIPEVFPDDTLDLCRLTGYPIGLKEAVRIVFGYQMVTFRDIVPRGRVWSDVPPKNGYRYGCSDADWTLRLYEHVKKVASIEGSCPSAISIYNKFYTSIRPILYNMERRGVRIDRAGLESWRDELIDKIRVIRCWLAEEVGIPYDEFNPGSVYQLRPILFEKFGYKPVRRSSQGYSTDEDTLLVLLGENPNDAWLHMLMWYREYNKQLTTYADPFLTSKDGRIHFAYSAGVSTTGRLNSFDPNGQNIPLEARRFFIPDE